MNINYVVKDDKLQNTFVKFGDSKKGLIKTENGSDNY